MNVVREERCEGIFGDAVLIPPYSLLQIASLLRNGGHEVYLIDANCEKINYDQLTEKISVLNYAVLLFRFTASSFDWDMETARVSKENHPNAKTIGICWALGSFPEKVLEISKYLDIYVMHEYEVVVPSLISTISRNDDLSKVKGIAFRSDDEIHVNEVAKPISDYDSLPLPAYDLLPSLDGYYRVVKYSSPFTIMYTSKGCPFSCTYCTVARTKWKPKSAQSILEELRYLKRNYNIKTVTFFDEVFTLNRKRVVDVAETIKNENLNIKWICDTRVDLVDKELLEIMADGGCDAIAFGVESGSQRLLDNVKKRCTVEQAENAIKWAKDAGIKVHCNLMFGLPGENWETVNETIGFLKRTLPNGIQAGATSVKYGAELREIALKEGWIKDDAGSCSGALFQYVGLAGTDAIALSKDELNRTIKLAYKTLYFNPRWILQNIKVVFKTQDFRLGMLYVLYMLKNHVFNRAAKKDEK